MSVEQNESLAMLRRYRDTLSISGLAIIAFGVWDILKAILSFMFGGSVDAADQEADEGIQAFLEALADRNEGFIVAIIVGLFLMVIIGFALRIYVGLSAHAEAHGKQKSWTYVIVAGLMATTSATLMIAGLVTARNLGSALSIIITGTIELTSMFAYVDLIRSAVIVKRLSKSLAEGR